MLGQKQTGSVRNKLVDFDSLFARKIRAASRRQQPLAALFISTPAHQADDPFVEHCHRYENIPIHLLLCITRILWLCCAQRRYHTG